MTGPPSALPLTLNNPAATQDLLKFLGVKDRTVRFSVIDAILPVAIVREPDPVDQERPAIGTLFVTAVALELPHTQLLNPAGSGRDIHVDSVVLFSTTAQIFHIRLSGTALATNAPELGFRDRRQPGTPVGQVRRSTAVGSAGLLRGRGILDAANAEVIYPLDFTLPPGTGILAVGATVNTDMSATYFWEELPE